MALFRPTGSRAAVNNELIAPGDVMAGGENILAGSLTTAGNGTWTGAMIATGIIRRTGPGGGFTDTTDTSTNILLALAGNSFSAVMLPGTSFRLRLINTVAFAHTFAAGAGILVGTGLLSVAASGFRDYLLTILNASPAITQQANTVNANPAITFVLPIGMLALPMGPTPQAVNITPGMTVSGAGITAGATVIGVTQGQGGIIGVTISPSPTATTTAGGTPLTFLPTILIDSLGSGTL